MDSNVGNAVLIKPIFFYHTLGHGGNDGTPIENELIVPEGSKIVQVKVG